MKLIYSGQMIKNVIYGRKSKGKIWISHADTCVMHEKWLDLHTLLSTACSSSLEIQDISD